MGNFPFSRHDLKIELKRFQDWVIVNFYHVNTDDVKAMGFIRIKIFNDFCNVIFSKQDSWKKVICSFKGIARKFPSIFN